MSEDQVRKGLEQCNLCNVALVSAIKERVAKGEDVKNICKDYETFQRQLHGEVLFSAGALVQRYRRATGQNDPVTKRNQGGRPPKYLPKSEKPPTEGFEFRKVNLDDHVRKDREAEESAQNKLDNLPNLKRKVKVASSMEYVTEEGKLQNEFDYQIRKLQTIVEALLALKGDFAEYEMVWNQTLINKVIGGLK